VALRPLDCCALIYRNPTVARKVLAQQAGYLDILHSSDDEHYEWNPSDFAIHCRAEPVVSPSGSRSSPTARRLRRAPCRARSTCHRTQQKIAALDYVEMVRPISLSIVLFRRKGWTSEQYTEWSHHFLRDQIAFVTPTKWEGGRSVVSRSYIPTRRTNSWIRSSSHEGLEPFQQRIAGRSCGFARCDFRRQAMPPSASSTMRLPK